MVSKDRDLDVFKLELSADMADLQRNMTGLLGSQLDKDDHCGDRIAIQNATLTPTEPASLATVQLHYERWACIKAFGKQQAKRVVGGNAVIPVKLTPGVDENKTELRLVPEVGTIQADGFTGGVAALWDGGRNDTRKDSERDFVGYAERDEPQCDLAARGAGLRHD